MNLLYLGEHSLILDREHLLFLLKFVQPVLKNYQQQKNFFTKTKTEKTISIQHVKNVNINKQTKQHT